MDGRIKKILLLTQSTSGGGAERVLTHLANGFVDKGYDVTYAALYHAGYYSMDDRINKDVISAHTKHQALFDLIRLRKYLKNRHFDSIICFGYPISVKYSIASFLLRHTRVIMSERNDPARNIRNSMMKNLRIWAYSKSDVVVFQTDEAKNYFPISVASRGVVIPNPLILTRAFNKIENRSRIIALGRISPQKNFSVLLRAFSIVLKKIPGIDLVIYGAKEEKEYLTLSALVKELDLQAHVSFAGFTDDVYSELENSMLYVSSSDYEGISNSVMEAMACGLPVICTDCPCGGNRWLINNNQNGILVPVGDYNEMAKAMIRVIKDVKFQKKLGKNAMSSMEAYSIDNVITKWEKIL